MSGQIPEETLARIEFLASRFRVLSPTSAALCPELFGSLYALPSSLSPQPKTPISGTQEQSKYNLSPDLRDIISPKSIEESKWDNEFSQNLNGFYTEINIMNNGNNINNHSFNFENQNNVKSISSSFTPSPIKSDFNDEIGSEFHQIKNDHDHDHHHPHDLLHIDDTKIQKRPLRNAKVIATAKISKIYEIFGPVIKLNRNDLGGESPSSSSSSNSDYCRYYNNNSSSSSSSSSPFPSSSPSYISPRSLNKDDDYDDENNFNKENLNNFQKDSLSLLQTPPENDSQQHLESIWNLSPAKKRAKLKLTSSPTPPIRALPKTIINKFDENMLLPSHFYSLKNIKDTENSQFQKLFFNDNNNNNNNGEEYQLYSKSENDKDFINRMVVRDNTRKKQQYNTITKFTEKSIFPLSRYKRKNVIEKYLFPSKKKTRPRFVRIAARSVLKNASFIRPEYRQNFVNMDTRKKINNIGYIAKKKLNQIESYRNLIAAPIAGLLELPHICQKTRKPGLDLNYNSFIQKNPTKSRHISCVYDVTKKNQKSKEKIMKKRKKSTPFKKLTTDYNQKIDEEEEISISTINRPSSEVSQVNLHPSLKNLPFLENIVEEQVFSKDPLHSISVSSLPDSCTACTIMLLSGKYLPERQNNNILEQSWIIIIEDILGENKSIEFLQLQETIINFVSIFLTQPSIFGTLFAEKISFAASNPEYNKHEEIYEFLCKVRIRIIEMTEKDSSIIIIGQAWCIIWVYAILPNGVQNEWIIPIIRKAVISPLFPHLDYNLKDSFQATALLSQKSEESKIEIINLVELAENIFKKWAFIFYLETLESKYDLKNNSFTSSTSRKWDPILKFIKESQKNIEYSLHRVYTLVTLFSWEPRIEISIIFRDVFFGDNSKLEYSEIVRTPKKHYCLSTKYLHILDKIINQMESTRSSIFYRLMPTTLDSLNINAIYRVLGLVARFQIEFVQIFQKMEKNPHFLEILPEIFRNIIIMNTTQVDKVFTFLLKKIFELKEKNIQIMLSLAIELGRMAPDLIWDGIAENIKGFFPLLLPQNELNIRLKCLDIILDALEPFALSANENNSKNKDQNLYENPEDEFFDSINTKLLYLSQDAINNLSALAIMLETTIFTRSHYLEDTVDFNPNSLIRIDEKSESNFLSKSIQLYSMAIVVILRFKDKNISNSFSRTLKYNWPPISLNFREKCIRVMLLASYALKFGIQFDDYQNTELFAVAAFFNQNGKLPLVFLELLLKNRETSTFLGYYTGSIINFNSRDSCVKG